MFLAQLWDSTLMAWAYTKINGEYQFFASDAFSDTFVTAAELTDNRSQLRVPPMLHWLITRSPYVSLVMVS